MKIIAIVVLAGSFSLSACKKERTCECKNSNSTYTAGSINATKSHAKTYCKSLSTSATECYLK